MSLSASAQVVFGNQRYESHVIAVDVTLALLPAVDVARVSLPSCVDVSASPGDDAQVVIDGGEGAQTVLTGRVRGVRRGLETTEVTVGGGGVDLSFSRKTTTYDGESARKVIEAMAGEAGVDVGSIDVDLSLSAYVASARRTAAEHIAELSRLGGAIARFDADGALEVSPWPASGPDVMLRYGRELIAYASCEQPGAPTARIVVGHGPAGSVDAPDALKHSVTPLPGNAPADALREPVAILRTPAAASSASAAVDGRFRSADVQLRARCFLLPGLRPGQSVSCADLPESVDGGPWLLHRLVHRLNPDRGGQTHLWGSAVEGGAGPLLDQVPGAIGGLL